MIEARVLRHTLAGILLVLPLVAGAACDQDPECDDLAAWADFTRVMLKLSYPASTASARWHAMFDHEAMDALIESETRGADATSKGIIALVGGRVMLSKDLELKPGYVIDALDAPVLSIRLAMILLSRILPDGPEAISGRREVDLTDTTGIKYATMSASGYIPAPWQVQGWVEAVDNGITFDLTLTFPLQQAEDKAEIYTMNLGGTLGKLGRPVFQDADSLAGWTVYGVGPREIKTEGGMILDYGATPEKESQYRTIGDLRAFIAVENAPGYRDAAKDFTGFWKTDCDHAFGLRIMHQGEEGKYAIDFCGPGGCGDSSDDQLTFISGDRRWEVVSEEELVQISRAGNRQTYKRCTRETNPALKHRD